MERRGGEWREPVVTLCSWELAIPGARSLKEKRSVLRSLRDRLARMNVSFAESGLQEQRGRAHISVAFLAAHAAHSDSVREAVDRVVAGARDVYVVSDSTRRLG